MPNVSIRGYGVHWFPDGMSREEMLREAKRIAAQTDAEKIDYGPVGNFLAGAVGGVGETIGSGIAGLAKSIPGIGDDLGEAIEDVKLSTPTWIPRKGAAAEAGRIAGSTGTYIGAGLIPGAGPFIAGGLGVGASMEDQRERMHQAEMEGKEVSDMDRLLSLGGGAALGTLQAIPPARLASVAMTPLRRMLNRGTGEAAEAGLKAAKEALDDDSWRAILGSAAKQTALQGGIGGTAAVGGNLLEKQYNPERDALEGVGMASGVSAGVGGLADIALGAMGRRAARGRIARPGPKPLGLSDEALDYMLSLEQDPEKRAGLMAVAAERGLTDAGKAVPTEEYVPFARQFAYEDLFDKADRREARRTGREPIIPEEGIPEGVARGMDARERLARQFGKEWSELSNSERLTIDDWIAEGYTGAGGGGEEPPPPPPPAPPKRTPRAPVSPEAAAERATLADELESSGLLTPEEIAPLRAEPPAEAPPPDTSAQLREIERLKREREELLAAPGEPSEPAGLGAYIEDQRAKAIEDAAVKVAGNISTRRAAPPVSETLQEFGLTNNDFDQVVARVQELLQPLPKSPVAETAPTTTPVVETPTPVESPQPDVYADAVRLVQEAGKANTSTLQRKLRVSNDTANELLNRMESEGIVGPAEGSKPRQVLAPEPVQPEVQLRTPPPPEPVSETVPESVPTEPVSVPELVAETPQPVADLPLSGALHEEFFRPDLGVKEEELASFLDATVNRGVPVKQAIEQVFGKGRSLDAVPALTKMDVIGYDPDTKGLELTFNPKNRPPAARVLPEEAPTTPVVPRETEAKPANVVLTRAQMRDKVKELAPDTDLYTPQEFFEILKEAERQHSLYDALVVWARSHKLQGDDVPNVPREMDTKYSRKTDEELTAIWQHITKNRPELFRQVEYPGGVFDYELNTRAESDFQGRARAALEQELADLGGTEQATILELADTVLTRAGDPAEAAYVPEKNLLRISLAFANKKLPEAERIAALKSALRQDIVHILREKFTEKEWATVARNAAKRGYLAEAQELYKNQADYTPEKFVEESVANLFRDRFDGLKKAKLSAGSEKLYERFTTFVQRMGNAFQGLGFQTADDVLARLASGELGQRRPSGPTASGEMYSLPRPKPGDRFLAAARALRAGKPLEQSFNNQELEHIRGLVQSGVDLDAVGTIDPTEFITIRKMDLSQRVAEQFANNVAVGVELVGGSPKSRQSFNEIIAKGNALLGDEFDKEKLLGEMLKGSQNTLKPEVRYAAAKTVMGLEKEIYRQQTELGNTKGLSVEALTQRQNGIDRQMHDMQELLNILWPARTQDGRNLAFHKIMARGGFDPLYWQAQAKRQMSLPPDANLPASVADPLNKLLINGKGAQGELEDALANAKADPTPANQLKAKAAEKKVLEAQTAVAQQLADARKTSWLDFGKHFWKAGLLSGPKTPIANQFSNGGMNVLEKLSSVPANWIDAAIGVGTGRRSLEQQFRPETILAELSGQREGWAKVPGLIKEGFASRGTPETQKLGKIDVPRLVKAPEALGRAGKLVENAINGIYSIQQAGDVPWSTGARERYLIEHSRVEARNQARAGELKGQSIEARAAELRAKAAEDISSGKIEEGTVASRVMRDVALETFANDTPFSKGWEQFKRGMEQSGGAGGKFGAFVADGLMPFVKVPTNVLARVIEYSPLGLPKIGVHVIRAALNKSLNVDQQRMISQLLARGAVGSAIGIAGYAMAAAGNMSGIRGTSDVSGKAADEAVGRPQGSIRFGDRWYQINRLAPLGNLLTLGASIFQESGRPLKAERGLPAGELSARRIGNLGATALQTVAELPMLQGAMNLVSAVANPATFGTQFGEKTLGSAVPTLASDIAVALDPKQRDLRAAGVLGSTLSRIPIARQTLVPERYDVLGRGLERPGLGGGLGSLLDITRSQPAQMDRVSQEVERSRWGIGRLQEDKKAGESDEAYRLRAALAGRIEAQGLDRLYRTSTYRRAREDDKLDMADKVHAKARSQTKKLLEGKRAYVKGDDEQKQEILYKTLQRYRELR